MDWYFIVGASDSAFVAISVTTHDL